MSNLDYRQLLIDVFLRLRAKDFSLGVGELLDALRLAESDLATGDLKEFQLAIELLWCHSYEETYVFRRIWADTLETANAGTVPPSERRTALPPPPRAQPPKRADEALPKDPAPAPNTPKSSSEWAALPVRAPFSPALSRDSRDLQTYWPVSRRVMAYAWRYLRRPIPDGPADIVDVTATIERTAHQGFFLGPIYRRRERNHAHLLLLADQNGSMVPFHRFTRDLVETAQTESAIEQVEVFYFHNTPADHLYHDPHLSMPMPQEEVLAQCTPDTSVLLVSDAGAARGYRELSRVRATTKFLTRLRQRTTMIAWLNPMPQQRWPNTSAQIIAHLVPMFQMDPDGLSSAIDVARGQPRLAPR